jgi:hypothetical protein
LGVLAVGLGVFSLALRSGEGTPQAGTSPRSASSRPSTRTETLPAAVVDHLAPTPPEEAADLGAPAEIAGGPTMQGGRNKLAGHPDGARAGRVRRPRTPGGTTDSTGDDVGDESTSAIAEQPAAAKGGAEEAPPPAATPAVAEVRETPTLEEAEKLQADMEAILVSLGPKITACAKSADVVGNVEVRVSVGADGAVKASRLLGDLDGTPAGPCIQTLVQGTRYPRFSGASIKLSHRFSVE